MAYALLESATVTDIIAVLPATTQLFVPSIVHDTAFACRMENAFVNQALVEKHAPKEIMLSQTLFTK